jgi:rod shape-determining protein MreD
VITFLGIPVLALLAILQSAVISRLNVAYGTADIILLVLTAWALQSPDRKVLWWAFIAGIFVSVITAAPFYSVISGYLLAVLLAIFLRSRLWNIPILTMVLVSFIGTLITLLITFVGITITRTSLPFMQSLVSIILPSCALNMFLGIPIFLIIKDLVDWIYPREYV